MIVMEIIRLLLSIAGDIFLFICGAGLMWIALFGGKIEITL